MSDEWFNQVDQNGISIGKVSRTECHNGSKILHSVIHIHIINSKKQILLQKRSIKKDIQPGKWDTSVGGHVQFNEPVQDAILREAKEELGIFIDLNKIVTLHKYVFESSIENELVFSYLYYYDGPFFRQEEEIDEINFFSQEEIKQMISHDQLTPNFIQEFFLLTQEMKIL